MAANGHAQAGSKNPPGHWGKYRGVTCSVEECDKPARARGMCMPHYNKKRWADGHRPPSANPVANRAAHLKHRYGITAEEYDRLVVERDGTCDICGDRPQENSRWYGRLVIDHDHDTGAMRGLLCSECNLLLKKDLSAGWLRSAAEYLERHG